MGNIVFFVDLKAINRGKDDKSCLLYTSDAADE